MEKDLKIHIKRVGNGYLVSKNFNEIVVMVQDRDPMETRGLTPHLLELCSTVLMMLGEPEKADTVCFSYDTFSGGINADGTGNQYLSRNIETFSGITRIDHTHSDKPPTFGNPPME